MAIAPSDPLPEAERATLDRLESGMLEGMGWFTRERVHLACNPARLVPGARSVVVLAKCYLSRGGETSAQNGPCGRIARYAWGEDYHSLFPPMVDEVVSLLSMAGGSGGNARVFVDSGPLAEKAVAVRSGLGWYGKNGLLLTPGHGSWVLLAEIVSDLKLSPGDPLARDCGECRLCMDRCPTGAIVAPYVVDARRCISYLTIEHRGAIPRELRPLMENWIFGCDACQEVCPHNRHVRPTEDPVFAVRKEWGPNPVLSSLMALDSNGFKRLFHGSPLLRAKRRGLLRNVAVALGNARDPDSVLALIGGLEDQDALVRRHAVWALGEIGGRRARAALQGGLNRETDEDVLQEIHLALDR